MPDDVEDIIADLAVVFGWTPSDCSQMSVFELVRWHDKAKKRSEAK